MHLLQRYKSCCHFGGSVKENSYLKGAAAEESTKANKDKCKNAKSGIK